MASRSLDIRLTVDRADPENREFKHSNPIGWTKRHRTEILAVLYTILLGNPQLRTAHDAEGKTRFKMWWRLVGLAVEYAAGLTDHKMDFQSLFGAQVTDDEESATLADVLEVMIKQWPVQFTAADVAGFVNVQCPGEEAQTLRDFLQPGSVKSIGRYLKKHLDAPVNSGGRTLALRSKPDSHLGKQVYNVAVIPAT